jgi:hypothetical protein
MALDNFANFSAPVGAHAEDYEAANSNLGVGADQRASRTACSRPIGAESARTRSRRALRGNAGILHPWVLPQSRHQPRTLLQPMEKWSRGHRNASGPKDSHQHGSSRVAPPNGRRSARRAPRWLPAAMRQKLSAIPCGICRAPDGRRATRLFLGSFCRIAAHPAVLAYVNACRIGGSENVGSVSTIYIAERIRVRAVLSAVTDVMRGPKCEEQQ